VLRWLGIGGAVGFALAAIAAIAAMLYFDRIGEWAIRSEVLPELEARLGREVGVGSIAVGRRTAVLEELEVAGDEPGEPLITIAAVRVEYSLRSVLRKRPEIALVVIEGARVHLDLDDPEDALLARLSRRGGPGSGADSAGSSIRPDRIELKDAAVTAVDRARGLTISARDIDAELELDGGMEVRVGHAGWVARMGPTGSASDVHMTAQLDDPIGSAVISIGDGGLSLAGGFALTSIRGELRSGEAGALVVDLEGSYGGASERLWGARGWIDPRTRTGDLTVEAERFTLDRIAEVLGDTPIRRPENAAIGASLRIEVGEEVASFQGDVELSGLTVAHRMLATAPIEDLEIRARVRGEIDRLARALALDEAEVEVGDVRYGLDGYLHLPGGLDPITAHRRTKPRGGMRVTINPVDCQAMLDSIPAAFVPRLQGFELRGEFAADVRVDVDLEHIEATQLGGEIGIHGCEVLRAPRPISAARLRNDFVHQVNLGEDEWLRVELSEKNPDFVPIDQVSPHLINALMTTEDSGFFSHDGFVRRQFRTALVRNLEAGHFRYGASSITMQMVKNVLLHNEKTLSRKLQELFLTWYVESELDKERIMEIYVNAIEFGPGVYGIGRAARHYFGTRASELNPVEAAFFSSILPNPKGRYRQFCRGELSRWTAGKIERVIDLMYERDRLTPIEHQIALQTPLFFDRSHIDSEARCLQRVRRAIERAPSTTPELEGDELDELAAR
jgi:hypothetical protein